MFKSNVKYLGFNDFWFTVIGVIALGFIIPQVFFGVKLFDPNINFPSEWLEASLYALCYWAVNRVIIIWFRKKYPLFEMAKKRLILVVITCLVIVSLAGFIISPIISFFFGCFDLVSKEPSTLQNMSATFTSSFFLMAVYESIWYYSQLKHSIQTQEKVKNAHVQSQLDGLRNQVNPHFLFNSLNTLNHIVEYEDKKSAKNFINQLSKVYRYILDSREDSTIILSEEIEFVEAYIAIQKERFIDNLEIEVNVPNRYHSKKIIPLSLQLLIENAIKHNVISSKKPLRISIDINESEQSIMVTNNLQRKSQVLHSTKVGLQNILERYRLLSENKSVVIEEDKMKFSVSIPLID